MYKKISKGWSKHLDFMILDLICLHVSFVLAYFFRNGIYKPYQVPLYRKIAVIMTLIDIVIAIFFHTLKNVLKRGYYREFAVTAKHVCLVELSVTCYLFMVKESQSYSRMIFFYMGVLYLFLSYAVRLLWKKYLKEKQSSVKERSLLIVTIEEMVDETVESIRCHNYEGFRIAGLALLNQDRTGDMIGGVEVVAARQNLFEYVCREWVDEVFINVPHSERALEELTEKFNEMGVVVHIGLVKTGTAEGPKQFVERMGGYTVLTSSLNYATPLQAFIKRAMDIAGGLLGCVITAILFLFLAPIIYIKSPGPIFFAQERVGRNGKRFKMYKFRSMYMDAEERKKELMAQNRVKDGMMFKLDWDPRIIGARQLPDGTFKKGIGNYIRDWSLDEFPQFYNVLKGDMSLVGTRPPTVDEWEKYELHHRARLSAKPGVTGMWQVSGRSNITDFEEVVKLDRKYICEWSMGLDLRILFKTIAVVLKKDGSM